MVDPARHVGVIEGGAAVGGRGVEHVQGDDLRDRLDRARVHVRHPRAGRDDEEVRLERFSIQHQPLVRVGYHPPTAHRPAG